MKKISNSVVLNVHCKYRTSILINNAAVELKSSFLQESAAQKALFEMKVNYIGLINMINCFVPILEKTRNL